MSGSDKDKARFLLDRFQGYMLGFPVLVDENFDDDEFEITFGKTL